MRTDFQTCPGSYAQRIVRIDMIPTHTIDDTPAPGVAAARPDGAGICIGTRRLPSRYFLAPLAGYTHLAFRTAVRELGGLGLATTDLVQATMLLSGTRKSLELVATSPADHPLSVQIFSGKTDELVRAARWLQERGYQGVDINMGCPMAKINGQGGGARLMCDTEGARRTVAAVVDAVDLPVTVKMRLGWDADQITAPLLAHEFEQVGVAAITVHGRTRAQGFHGSVDLDGIRQVVEAVDSIPIVGNGDVRTVEDALRMRAVTGCAAVAIGRGAMMDPWIFRKLAEIREGEAPAEPTLEELIAFLVRHFQLMTEQHGESSCLLFRKFAAWYGAKLGIPEDLEDRLRRIESFAEFDEVVEQIHHRHGERETSVPTALMKVPNGPNERW
jgi:tRNA-dihydrouridine synthase B